MLRCALLCLAAMTAAAHADDKHAIVVLGVMPKEAALAKSAGAITSVIRTQAGAKSSEYKLAGKPKDIEAALLAAECSTIEARCAAKLGGALGGDFAIAGELDRQGTHQVLVLALVDVRTKQRVRSVRQTSSGDAKKLARTAYTRLVGGDVGELAVVANAQQGEVLIDGQVVAGLFEGRATIGGLVKGSHLLAIRAKGFRPFEVDVMIEAQTKQQLLLEPE